MTACLDKLRAALVAVLAVALLLGPCLSISGFTATASANAHGPQTQSAPHDHASMGHAGHGMSQAAADTSSGGDTPPGCEQMCDGWAVKAAKPDVLKPLAALPWRAAAQDDGPTAILTAFAPATGPPAGIRSTEIAVLQDAWLARVSGYALTNRYRL